VHFVTRSAYGADKAVAHDPPQLYHLGIDPGERFNVADKYPDVAIQLAEKIRHVDSQVDRGANQLE
jgi:arylsulfatase A